MTNTWDRWSEIISCEKCGRNNPADISICLNCGDRFTRGRLSRDPIIESRDVETNSFRIRPYSRPNAVFPFTAERNPEEIQQALAVILEEDLFSWDADRNAPGELTDAMIADAESTIRLRLPAALLAILKMQNGGRSSRDIRDLFETFIDEDFYLKWWETLNGGIHPAWCERPRIPESILLIAEELHWGIGLTMWHVVHRESRLLCTSRWSVASLKIFCGKSLLIS